MTVRYVVGDTRDYTATIPDGSVDLLLTSPPFLALRSYLPADHPDKGREIGSEANPAAFLDTLLELTAEWRRVLAPHGTLAVELGDTYSGSGEGGGDTQNGSRKSTAPEVHQIKGRKGDGWPLAKSLACIPQLYQIALAYGINPLTGTPSPAGRWRVRNVIAWHRPNPPVGALGDKWRPASSQIVVACTGARRWFDMDAVRTEHQHGVDPAAMGGNGYGYRAPAEKGNGTVAMPGNPAGAPPLDWHTDGDLGVGHIVLATQPYAGSHYATFPMELPRRVIDCMCPRQVCRVCGKARERMVGPPTFVNKGGRILTRDEYKVGQHGEQGVRAIGVDSGGTSHRETLGWSDCGHDNYRPGVIFDPFAGTGTTLAAAQDLGRDAIGVDLDPRNAWLARERVGMFLEIEGAAS